MKCYKVKVGNLWARGGDYGSLVETPERAKSWKTRGHAKAHITNVLKRAKSINRRNSEYRHPYEINDPLIMEFDLRLDTSDLITVSFPTKDLVKLRVLADYLEEIGFNDASEALRRKI